MTRRVPKLLMITALSLGQVWLPGVATARPAPVSEEVLELAARCAPDIHPLTMGYLVANESSNGPYAFNVNSEAANLPPQPGTLAEARQAVEHLEQAGVNYDLGYGQINSGNFDWLGVSAVELLDPCTNLQASQRVLIECYDRASARTESDQAAVRDALSCYNTGSLSAGHSNGYVSRVEKVAQQHWAVPELIPAGHTPDGRPNRVRVPASGPSGANGSEPENQQDDGEPDAFAAHSAGDAFAMANDDGQ